MKQGRSPYTLSQGCGRMGKAQPGFDPRSDNPTRVAQTARPAPACEVGMLEEPAPVLQLICISSTSTPRAAPLPALINLLQEGAASPAYQVRASNLLLPCAPELEDATSLGRASRARTEILKLLLRQAREDSPSNLSFGSPLGSAWRSTAQGRSQLRLFCRKAICLLQIHSPRQDCCLKDYSRQSYRETVRPFHSQGKQKERL